MAHLIEKKMRESCDDFEVDLEIEKLPIDEDHGNILKLKRNY